ncbi:MAG: hypothetical protein J6P87_07245, partial [Lachnospiraceae bacterium]|nr:hypothetical protein [Lachnospiraceae bacterium]
MKKIRIMGCVVLPLLLLAMTALNVRAEEAVDSDAVESDAAEESVSAGEQSAEVSEAIGQAEAAFRQSFDDVPVLGEDQPMPDDMYLCGPYLYIGPAGDGPDDLFIPDQKSYKYEPGDLPHGAEICADETLVQVTDVPEGARAVFPVLYCPGYSDSAS